MDGRLTEVQRAVDPLIRVGSMKLSQQIVDGSRLERYQDGSG